MLQDVELQLRLLRLQFPLLGNLLHNGVLYLLQVHQRYLPDLQEHLWQSSELQRPLSSD